jgi:hypothetical protein
MCLRGEASKRDSRRDSDAMMLKDFGVSMLLQLCRCRSVQISREIEIFVLPYKRRAERAKKMNDSPCSSERQRGAAITGDAAESHINGESSSITGLLVFVPGKAAPAGHATRPRRDRRDD